MAARCTTGLVIQVDRSGWTTSAALVEREILARVHTEAGVFTTVNIVMMSLCRVTHGLTETVRMANQRHNVSWT